MKKNGLFYILALVLLTVAFPQHADAQQNSKGGYWRSNK